MELIKTFLDYALHLKDHLKDLTQTYGALTNLILFVVVFCETGLVVTPFLPGDVGEVPVEVEEDVDELSQEVHAPFFRGGG